MQHPGGDAPQRFPVVPGIPDRIVIAGAGLAALRTAEELRGRGYGGAITLVGAEARPPYDRPPLSKKVLSGELDDTSLSPDLSSLKVTACLGETATGLAADSQSGDSQSGNSRSGAEQSRGSRPGGVLRTDRGEHRFDRLVLATGARPMPLAGTAAQRFLHSIDEALALRELLRPGLRLAIIGAGWIGAELATAAAARGCQVTVLEAAAAPLAGGIGPQAGLLTASWYAEAGVDLRLGQRVDSVEPGGVALAGGGWLAADEVVTAIGVRPDLRWLDGSGVALDNGVVVDAGLSASVPGVFAAGDCAAFWSQRYQRRLRVEHWDVAVHGPTVLAANLLGGDDSYNPVPYFWSEQFGRMVQYAGSHHGAQRMIVRGDPAGARWAACWLAGDTMTALLTVNSPRDLSQGRRLIESALPVDAGLLSDPLVPLHAATRS